jgi:hypothetical protein
VSGDLAGFTAGFDEALPLLFRRESVRAFGDESLGSGCGSNDLVDHLVMTSRDLRSDDDSAQQRSKRAGAANTNERSASA